MRKDNSPDPTGRALRIRELTRHTLVYAAATLVLLTCVAGYFDFLYTAEGPRPSGTPTPESATSTPMPSPSPTPVPPWSRTFVLADLPASPEVLFFTEDGTRCFALKDGVVTVHDTATLKVVDTITATDPIQKCYLMVDQDILVYFYIESSSHALKICTYNLGTTVHYVRRTVPFPAGTSVRLVDYCKGMSFVVYETSTTNGSTTTWNLGWLYASTHIKTTEIHNPMVRMISTNLIYHIYSETPEHMLYYGTKPIAALKGKKLQLIGIDAMDNVYALSLADGVTVHIIKDGLSTGTFQLPSADHKAFFTDKRTVYAAYDGYVLDLLAKTTSRLDIPTGLTYVAVGGKSLYFRDAEGAFFVFDMPFK
jgi:hypothetical protein